MVCFGLPMRLCPFHVMRRSRNLVVLDGLAILARAVSLSSEPSTTPTVLPPGDAEIYPNEVQAS